MRTQIIERSANSLTRRSQAGHQDRRAKSRAFALLNSAVLQAGFLFLALYLIILASNSNYDVVVSISRASFRLLESALSTLRILSGLGCAKAENQIVPYHEYILAPASRTLHPVLVRNINGTVSGAQSLIMDHPGSAVFHGQSALTMDYGKNIAGVVSLLIGNISSEKQVIGVTFSESSLWISGVGSDATAESGIDEVLWIQPTSPGTYTVSREHERGAFRYLSLIHNSMGVLEVRKVTTHFTAMPHYGGDRLRDYTGYFHSNGTPVLCPPCFTAPR